MRLAALVKYVGLPAAGVGLLYSASLMWYPPAAAGILALAGRGPGCGVVETVKASRRIYRKYPAFSKEINTSARLLRKDPAAGLQLVATTKGEFWEPAVEGSAVTAQLAEISSKYDGFAGAPIRTGDIVLDCGANVGVFSREALSLGARLVVAIEPAPINIECLRRNLAGEIAAGRVVVCEKGVWDREDMLRLREDESTSAMDGFVKSENTREGPLVPLTTLDRLVGELKLERVDFIKMDIEGAERRALAGGFRTLGRFHPRLEISVNHLPDDPEVVSGIVRQAWPGYRRQCLLCSLEPMKWRVRAGIYYYHPQRRVSRP
jgi:FkbM family methyltransferase